MVDHINNLEQDFKAFLDEQRAYMESIMLMQWDLRTKIPKKGVEQRSEVVGFLSEKLHRLETSDRIKYFIDTLKDQTNDDVIRKTLEDCEETYERNKRIPHHEYKEFVMLQSQAESIWQEAREKDDFRLFQPYLEQLVEYKKKFANYWGYEDHIYDALLHEYEPGITTKVLDQVFPALRKSISPLVKQINESEHQPDPSILKTHFPKEDQRAFTMKMLEQMGYDFDSGRLDETIHPFAIGINLNDVRITTRYDENDFRMAVFGTIHEGGHALYEQNIRPAFKRTPLGTGTSMGIHESQSLFWENLIGRSKAFWQNYYELFQSFAPAHFQNVTLDNFYRVVNEVKASNIRLEADELTYPLHIMVRYELEKALMNDDINVSDLPQLWKEKMKDYLGIEPASDQEGVLQDIHWAGGDFGYFPSYALGYMYAAQFRNTITKEINLNDSIAKGDFQTITNWLGRHIHQYGKSKKPLEILHDVTGEALNPEYLVSYLTEKYSDIYHLQ